MRGFRIIGGDPFLRLGRAGSGLDAGGGGVISRTVTVDNTGNAATLSNYQVRVNVSWIAPMVSDFSNVRFIDGATVLNFWRESYIASTSAVFWVKVPSIPGSATKTITMQYGSGISDLSSGTDTFLLFEDFPGFSNPLLTAGLRYSMVNKIGATYNLICNRQADGYPIDLYTASNPEGPWSAYGSNPVLSPGTAGAWDANRLAWGSIVLLSGVYYMYYGGLSAVWKIGLATSTDMIAWTKDGSNPLADGSDPVLLTDGFGNPVRYDGKYWMTKKDAPESAEASIGYATSITGPWTWAALDLHIGDVGAWDHTSVTPDCFIYDSATGSYVMFYRGFDGTYYKLGIATATTPDGTYTKDAGNPILASSETWEGSQVGAPTVVKFGDTWYMYYTGHELGSSNIGLAESSTLLGPYLKPLERLSLDIKLANPTFSAGVATISSGVRLESPATYQNKATRFLANFVSTNGDATNLKYIGYVVGTTAPQAIITTQRSQVALYHKHQVTTPSLASIAASISDAMNVYDIKWKADQVIVAIDGTDVSTMTTQVPQAALPVTIYNYEDAQSPINCDWILVREYSVPEPSCSLA